MQTQDLAVFKKNTSLLRELSHFLLQNHPMESPPLSEVQKLRVPL